MAGGGATGLRRGCARPQTAEATSDFLVASMVALKRAVCCLRCQAGVCLLGRRVLGDGLRALADGVLGQLSGQKQTDGRLDLAARDRRPAVVVRQTRRLGGDALEDVVDERIHDAHRLAADARVRVHLLQHLVDVDGVAFTSSPLLLLVAGARSFRLARGLLRSLACWFRWHDELRSADQ